MSEIKPRLNAGERFGKYRILGLIGRGTLSEVYRASDPDSDRTVALKTYAPGSVSEQTFASESATLTTLRHPNIMRVYEAGTEAGQHYVVMELVAGTNLRDVLSTSPTGLDREKALRIFTQLADAVASAHDQGAVHGNIKPDNVLLDSGERPVLTDFHLPSLRPTSAQERHAAYLAPEQTVDAPPTPQADIYALGVLLYEMITGDVPFKGDFASVIAQHQTAIPARPSQLRVDLDPRIDAAILKALSKSPTDRFASAREMVKALASSEVPNQYETVNLSRKDIPEISKRRSEIRRFELSRAAEPAVEQPQAAAPDDSVSILWVIGAAVLIIALLVAAFVFL